MDLTRACLKKAFRELRVSACGRFYPNEGGVAGYGNRMRVKSPAKWGLQIAEMIFQHALENRSGSARGCWCCERCEEKTGYQKKNNRRVKFFHSPVILFDIKLKIKILHMCIMLMKRGTLFCFCALLFGYSCVKQHMCCHRAGNTCCHIGDRVLF